ncbi:MAG: 2-amino-4-hydroxy-6-hydroxymethyldihydropteridine diphosphokinase [Bacteroidota bacterium]|nr:2-amino-4-hydroxy-6-hydroxymethyldihydropteridine diphosphokinase [Bacteroidota bacterium]
MIEKEVLLLLGGNEGDPLSLSDAVERSIGNGIGRILARSRDHWTEPWGFEDARLFLNRALLLGTILDPEVLMMKLLDIERQFGRIRKAGSTYGPRPIDIDILLIGDLVFRSELLEVPHPRMQQRAFALAPAADIAPRWVHPVRKQTVLQLLNGCKGSLDRCDVYS